FTSALGSSHASRCSADFRDWAQLAHSANPCSAGTSSNRLLQQLLEAVRERPDSSMKMRRKQNTPTQGPATSDP
ncbi:hypothetical protein pipiens_007364, partial [Culex pipiens pipiens]